MSTAPAASITESRSELKFQLEPSRAAAFASAINAHLPAHHFSGEGANRLPRARHFVTTVYFDTPSHALYRAVLANDENLKIRAREYYDVHPELLELATDSKQLVRYSPVLWVEIKHKTNGRTKKRRLAIPKLDVVAFFERGEVSAAMRSLQRDSSETLIDELLALRAELSEPLGVSCIVNYRRNAWEDAQGSLRVTLDQRLACYAPQAELWNEHAPLLRERLGRPAFEEPSCIVEVKSRGAAPDWLDDALAAQRALPSKYSKFAIASRAVHGSQQTG